MSFDARLAVIGKHKGYNYEKIDVEGEAIGLTSSILDTKPAPKRAFITSETARMRYRYDGEDPEATEGHILDPQDILTIEGIVNLTNFKVIRVSNSGVLRVSYER